MALRVLVLPGDGIGPEVTAQAVEVMKTVAEAFPGHNYAPPMKHSTIEQEKSHNPFCNFPSKSAFLNAMGFAPR